MIPFEFEYYKPASIQEAVQTFKSLQNQGKTVIYYNGGTEFITFSRINKMTAEAVIDLKGIPDCNVIEFQGEELVIGSSLSLNKISETDLYPLLSQTIKRVADHTSRNKITLGGNLNSRLIYRECLLPLLVADAKIKIAGDEGETTLPLNDIFDKEIKLNPSQFIVQILINKTNVNLPFVSLKKTKISKIGYPIVSLAAVEKDKQILAALSGVCEFPFRSSEMEAALNDTSLSIDERIDKALSRLPAQIIEDIQASAAYRQFVLKNTLREMLDNLEAAKA
ncbi:FAD binding domain-containing protein [Neobacillus sp. GCM10023253]|uniref:FAD binding domain-containing protein n=1 Tax=Neobacillus sp. GCM10023253 TaxID=3252644 RepID=UPI00360E8CEC